MSENVASNSRLAALRSSGLLDTPAEEGFDRLTRLATKTLGVPVALVSLVDDNRQFFKSAVGLPEPWASTRETPLTYSFCQHVVNSGLPLIVSDARTHPLVCENLAVCEIGVMAYAGMPLITPDGHVLGSFCAIDVKPRHWSEHELSVLKDLAASATSEIHLKWAKEVAEAANRAKERFLAVLSHELRTPISPALMIASSLAQNQTLSAEVREDAMTIQRNIAQQTRLIDDLLDVTRIEIGKLSINRETSDLHAILKDVVNVCKADADAKSIALSLTEFAKSHTVSGDAVRLRQIFSNLLKNAIKFTPDAGKVTIETFDGTDSTIVVRVKDTGIGVEPALLDNIFNVYEQGGRTITDEFSGLGLGLAISKGLVEAHDGTIAASSHGKGQGTTLTVELPTCAVPIAKPSPAPPKTPTPNPACESCWSTITTTH